MSDGGRPAARGSDRPAPAPTTVVRSWGTGLIVAGAALVLVAAGFLGGAATAIAVSSGRGSCDAAEVASRVLPSVVTVNVTGPSTSNGSGQVISLDGYILTNNHVIYPATRGGKLSVRFSDGHEAPAELVGRDPKTDLAVIRVHEKDPVPTIPTGDSGSLAVGQPVVALGAPLGLSSTVTAGIVSALGRTVPVPSDDDRNAVLVGAIQTDASINPGNSGGALVDCQGRLVGVNTAIATVPGSSGQRSSGSVGIGFAVPETTALEVAHELIEHGKVSYPTAGISVTPLPPSAAAGAGLSGGLYVQSVVAGGPASRAGLRPGDVVTELNGAPAVSADALTVVQLTGKAGDRVSVVYLRDGTRHEAEVTLAAG
ncbi:S1C family serine protease [Leifsonia sp. AG29]|uniref:S1C family serine protease n=1 Tax=Leifsonia sp. AG29 TaxID=2598860 RepID=UPI00131C1425|nr:trypsin-like peptidase domain-containing protein [Leifsonia sp. AG29]